MNQKRVILQGAFVLTIVGFVSRIIGFFYRIFLSHAIGAEGVGIYQLIFPVYTMAFSLTAAGIQTAISKNVSEKMALGDKKGARNTFFAGLILTTCGTLFVFISWGRMDFLCLFKRNTLRISRPHACFRPAFCRNTLRRGRILFWSEKNARSCHIPACGASRQGFRLKLSIYNFF